MPTPVGFLVAMNRDEKRSRVTALPPERFPIDRRQVLYPREPGGGTWLAINDAALCLALINWHRIPKEPKGKIESRGRVIPQLIGAANSHEVKDKLHELPLLALRPFRLILVGRNDRRLTEWRWDTETLTRLAFEWRTRHWFSSGYDETGAERSRTGVCHLWSVRDRRQLRKLHASHLPERGPFSICMHRSDAVTVSFSEISVSRERITMRYQAGSPCRNGKSVINGLRIGL